jgi:hypothetical protein
MAISQNVADDQYLSHLASKLPLVAEERHRADLPDTAQGRFLVGAKGVVKKLYGIL